MMMNSVLGRGAGLLWKRSTILVIRYNSTTAPIGSSSGVNASGVAGGVKHAQTNGHGYDSQKGFNSSGSEKNGKSSNVPFYIASLILGIATAQYLPISSIAKFLISEKLPKPNTGEADIFKDNLEKELQKLPLYQELSSDPKFESVRAWNYVDSNTLNELVTNGTLSTPGGFAIKPILFFDKENRESVSIYHVGEKLCGYPFLVHGGILATILDEILKRTSSLNFGIDPLIDYKPDKIKTKTIELQYKFPTMANSFLVVRCKNEGDKVEGRIETLNGKLLVKGIGTFEKSSSLPKIF